MDKKAEKARRRRLIATNYPSGKKISWFYRLFRRRVVKYATTGRLP